MKQGDEDDDGDNDDDDGDYDDEDDENGIKILYLSNEEMNNINRTLSNTEVQTTTMPNNTSIVDPTIETSQNIANIRKEQQEDETLKEAIKSLKMKNTQYYVRSLDGLLFHVENVNGREVHQLVLPKNRRQAVLKLAHDAEWAGHLAYKKTKQRINMVFFWPKMKEDIKEYCKTCNSCQMKRKATCYDQVPISKINAVMRPEQPLEMMNTDIKTCEKAQPKYVKNKNINCDVLSRLLKDEDEVATNSCYKLMKLQTKHMEILRKLNHALRCMYHM